MTSVCVLDNSSPLFHVKATLLFLMPHPSHLENLFWTELYPLPLSELFK